MVDYVHNNAYIVISIYIYTLGFITVSPNGAHWGRESV